MSLLIAFAQGMGRAVCRKLCEQNLKGCLLKTLIIFWSISQETKFNFDKKPLDKYVQGEMAQRKMSLVLAERKAVRRAKKELLREEGLLLIIFLTLTCLIICSVLWSIGFFLLAPMVLIFFITLISGFVKKREVYRSRLGPAFTKYVVGSLEILTFFHQVGSVPKFGEDGSVSYNAEKIHTADDGKFVREVIESTRDTAFQEALNYIIFGTDE